MDENTYEPEEIQKKEKRQIHSFLAAMIIVCVGTFAGVAVTWSHIYTQTYVNGLSQISADSARARHGKFRQMRQKYMGKAQAREVKGLYLTAYSAGSDQKLNAMIDLIHKTELNAIVIDVKDYSGLVLYDSDIELVNQLGLEDDRLKDPKAIVDKLHEEGIYVIARQTVFQDPILAEKKQEWAIKSKNGGLWRDHKGLAWVDPTKEEVWDYNMQIAKEVAAFGFDEINFDYVRFPSDGNMSLVAYTNGDTPKYEVMEQFYANIAKEMEGVPVYTSLDMFGFVMERHDGMSIGQRLEDAVDHVDYIMPMMYPSHYPSGHLNLDNPADHPGLVFENGMQKGMPYFEEKRAKARPWIQAFHLGAVYDAQKIRTQIDVIEKHTDGGWILWNASNRYGTDGLNMAIDEDKKEKN
ncbi:putative glycoside hydrolase [Candidatus Nomurabacteria bacterium]|nr:putative glycoside hydrolase [Candidatus Nomurabacteria bacterium]